MKKTWGLISLVCIFSCGDQTSLREIGTLERGEVSAIQYVNGTAALWALEDSGNENVLYKIGDKGEVLEQVTVANATNTDWEALASDTDGNLYIGDFGNNDNKRKDLAIYRIAAGRPDSAVAKIEFYYPEQGDFPPKKSNLVFDCEAFFELDGNFYLFTKNRSSKFDGSFSVYRLPNQEGRHKAVHIANLKSCTHYNRCSITDADISPDGKQAVLLSGDKIFIIEDFGKGLLTNDRLTTYELGHLSQKEGVCFRDDNTILIADEKDKHTGGKLYELELDKLKAKH